LVVISFEISFSISGISCCVVVGVGFLLRRLLNCLENHEAVSSVFSVSSVSSVFSVSSVLLLAFSSDIMYNKIPIILARPIHDIINSGKYNLLKLSSRSISKTLIYL